MTVLVKIPIASSGGDENPREIAHLADRWHIEDGYLHLMTNATTGPPRNQGPRNVACYAPGHWTSVREVNPSAGPFVQQ